MLDLLFKYAKSNMKVESIRQYLNDVRDEDGFSFSRSLRRYDSMREQFEEFLKPNHSPFHWSKTFQAAKGRLVREFSSMRLNALNPQCDADVEDLLPKRTTHSGFQFILTGLREKSRYMKIGVLKEWLAEENHARENGRFTYPILPGTRTQGSGAIDEESGEFTGVCKHKTRIVMMIGIWQILTECRYARPLQDRLARSSWYAAGKMPNVQRTLIGNMRRNCNYWASLDYSHFDACVSAWLLREAFDVIKTAFVEVDEELWDVIVNSFITKDVIMADGVYTVAKGVPSGSMFTQIIDSVVNYLVIATYLNHCGLSYDMFILGDDNLIFTKHAIDLMDLSSYIFKNFGMRISPDKSSQGKRMDCPTFLSRQWRPTGEWRHPYVLIEKMLFPERFREYSRRGFTPDDVFYAFYCVYPLGMVEGFDMLRFFDDHPYFQEQRFLTLDKQAVPGVLAYIRDYTMPRAV
jgi:hypothetical protein